MPENYVGIRGSAANNAAAVSARGALLTGTVPEAYKFYLHLVYDSAGVVASNNFLSIFNPVGSGKTVIFFQAEISNYSVGVTDTPAGASMTATRITAASGGSQIAPANISRFLPTEVNPVAEVRVSNPTVTTVGLALNAWQPPISDKSGGGMPSTTQAPGEGFACLPGQGIVFNTASGDVDQRWKLLPIWAEV